MEKVTRARRSLCFRETVRPDATLQVRANAADDVLHLLKIADDKFFPPSRAEIIRNRVTSSPALPLARVARIETSLRHWIRRREL